MDCSCQLFVERHKFKTTRGTENELALHTPIHCEASWVLFLFFWYCPKTIHIVDKHPLSEDYLGAESWRKPWSDSCVRALGGCPSSGCAHLLRHGMAPLSSTNTWLSLLQNHDKTEFNLIFLSACRRWGDHNRASLSTVTNLLVNLDLEWRNIPAFKVQTLIMLRAISFLHTRETKTLFKLWEAHLKWILGTCSQLTSELTHHSDVVLTSVLDQHFRDWI